MIPNIQQTEDWCTLIQALCTVGDVQDAQEIAQIGRKRIVFLREAFDLSATVKWHLDNLQEAIQILKEHRTLVRNIWDAVEWVEAYIAVTGHVERQNWCQSWIEEATPSLCLEVYPVVQETFGTLTEELFPWLVQRVHD
jgi:hypothetical protein